MQAQCSECKEQVDEDATTCPHCGFSPANEGALARRLGAALGWLLTGSIAGAPIGIPILAFVYGMGKIKEGQTPANPT